MEHLTLEAALRRRTSKGELKRLRYGGRVPAVIYGRGKGTEALLVEGKNLHQILALGGANVLVDLRISEGEQGEAKQETVMLKDIQRDILFADRIIHVDFIRISMTERIEVSVPLNFTGEPAGIQEGGIVQQVLREILVRCLPAAIPEVVEVDLSHLGIGDSITVGEITLDDKVELITAPDETVALVQMPEILEEEEEEEELEPGEEEAAEKPSEEESPEGSTED